MTKPRAIVIVCDSLGVGELPDAADFGDVGSNTLGHVLDAHHPQLPTLTRLGLNVAFYGREIGRASMFKLLRSVFSKGMEALLLETLLAARRAGVADDVWREIVETLEERPFSDVGANWMRTHGTAHARRYHEVVQVEELLRELGVEPLITRGTAALFERSTRLCLAKQFKTPPSGPEEVLGALDKLLRNA